MSDALEQMISIFNRGGWVMWPLLVLSVVSVAISLERAAFWLRLHNRGHRARMQRLTELLRSGRFSPRRPRRREIGLSMEPSDRNSSIVSG